VYIKGSASSESQIDSVPCWLVSVSLELDLNDPHGKRRQSTNTSSQSSISFVVLGFKYQRR
jgi:hypothetical protein